MLQPPSPKKSMLLPRHCAEFAMPMPLSPFAVDLQFKVNDSPSGRRLFAPQLPVMMQPVSNLTTFEKPLIHNAAKITYKQEDSLCNFQLLIKSFALSYSSGTYLKDDLRCFFDNFEKISAFGLSTHLFENDRMSQFNYSPSLSSFEIEINNFESFKKLIYEIQQCHPLHGETIRQYLTSYRENFGSRLYLELVPEVKLLLVGNIARLLFFEYIPPYNREVMHEKIARLHKMAPYLGSIRLGEINIFTSHFSVLFSSQNAEKNKLAKASFLAIYSFHVPQMQSLPITIPAIGIVPLKLDEAELAKRISTKSDEASCYFKELLAINRVIW